MSMLSSGTSNLWNTTQGFIQGFTCSHDTRSSPPEPIHTDPQVSSRGGRTDDHPSHRRRRVLLRGAGWRLPVSCGELRLELRLERATASGGRATLDCATPLRRAPNPKPSRCKTSSPRWGCCRTACLTWRWASPRRSSRTRTRVTPWTSRSSSWRKSSVRRRPPT